MSRLRICPFCKQEVNEKYPYLYYCKELSSWTFSHYCKHPVGKLGVTVDIYGDTEQEVIDKWNGVYEVKESESL